MSKRRRRQLLLGCALSCALLVGAIEFVRIRSEWSGQTEGEASERVRHLGVPKLRLQPDELQSTSEPPPDASQKIGKGVSETPLPDAALPSRTPTTAAPRFRNVLEGTKKGGQLLKAYDRHILDAIMSGNIQNRWGQGGAISICAAALIERLGRKDWVFYNDVEFNAEVSGGELRVVSAHIKKKASPSQPDDEFEACYSEKLRDLPVSCPSCREGPITFQWIVDGFFRR